jgi:hypothetical protein
MADPPLSLSSKSTKQQRLSRAEIILLSQPHLTKREVVRLISRELLIDRATAYAYVREIKLSQSETKTKNGEPATD